MSGRLCHKYGNLLKKVPLNNSVLTLLIFNLLLEYDLNLLSENYGNYYESLFLSCGTVRYAVREAVIILGTILKCFSQMKASKPYFPSEAVSRLSR